MKLIFALSVLVFGAGAQASQECIFGDGGSTYAYQMDEYNEPIFDIDERISLRGERLNGLTKTDKAAALQYFTDGGYSEINTEEKAIEELSEGYIAYYSTSYEYNFARFVQVGYYPGDNHYGAIYKIDSKGNSLERVAVITDGDIEDCTFFKK